MGEPLSPDHMFDIPKDEPEPHPAYDFFAPGPLPGYSGNPNNNNGWLEADEYLLGELEAMANEPMFVPAIEEVAELVAKAEEEHVVAPVVDIEDDHMAAPVIDMVEDLATLFGEDDDFEDDDFRDDDSEGVREEELLELMLLKRPKENTKCISAAGEELTAAKHKLKLHGQLVKKVIQVSDAKVAAGVSIGEIGPMVFAIEGQVQVMASQMVHAVDRREQVGAQVEQGQTQQVQVLQAAM
nr:hypothetical protein [Tanacetum cinerariifolium]